MSKIKIHRIIVLFITLTALSCHKTYLSNPPVNPGSTDSTKTLAIVTDSVLQTFVFKTDTSKNSTKTVNYLKTFNSRIGNKDMFYLVSNTSWKVVHHPNWLTVNPESGTGDTRITVAITENSTAQQSDSITISGTGISTVLKIEVLQLAMPTNQTADSLDYLKTFTAGAGDTSKFVIKSNEGWYLKYPSWLSVTPAKGSGDTIETVISQENTGNQRTGTIILSATDNSVTRSINVLQLSKKVPVTPPPVDTTYYYPFTNLGNTIIRKKLIAGTNASGDLISINNTTFDMEQSSLESSNSDITSLIRIYNATSPRSVKILYNTFQFANSTGYGIVIGTETPDNSDGYYDGAQFIGNLLSGNGTIGDASYSTHGLFLGFSANGIWKYNFINSSTYGCLTKARGIDNSDGVIAYNLLKNCRYSVRVKGAQNTNILNNTFYADNTPTNYSINFIVLSPYDDGSNPSTGTKIMNNIFYSNAAYTYMIELDINSLSGLQCDYNVYFDARNGGNPTFRIIQSDGSISQYSFSQWQALGYDTHSVVLDPKLDPVTLIPTAPIQHASNLGTPYNTGVDPSNLWNGTVTSTKVQGNTWQNGAFIK